ncbi:radial spoke head protein 3 homolog B-like isoform X2 [Symsagittifera roscoffensis]|uniref:radial spoke head protein 3 homolog B-like isoform X2 n=1 Tax=Symsagittifera roscoffensis TaxID=84072 RepID=UPI00307B8CED
MASMVAQRGPPVTETYQFNSQPRAAKNGGADQSLYRDDDRTEAKYGNIMYDRRVVRGNTYAQHTLPVTAQPDPIEIQRQQEARRRTIARKRAKDQLKPRSPEPVEGRKHINVQTELYLEELSDRVEESDIAVQTDAFLDRPPTPLFIPAKTGMDVETQIEEGDLFDFDVEVGPILEVLVGKTLEQSLLEVMEEEELANLRQQQRSFEQLRNAELVEQQRLEEQERRHSEEKLRRLNQQREVLNKEKETADKLAARAFAQSYLSDLIPSVFGNLTDHGFFYDPVERDVDESFIPWLMDRVVDKLESLIIGRTVMDGIIREVVSKREASFVALSRQQTGIKLESEPNVAVAVPEPAPSSAAGMSVSGAEGGETGADETSTVDEGAAQNATNNDEEDPSTEQAADDDVTKADDEEGKDDE